jgi:predicted phage replisome organizer
MSDVKWIKLKVNMFDDEKIRLIESMPEGDTMLVIWFKLLSQAGRTNANGYIFLNENVPYTPDMLSTLFNRPIQIVKYALQTFAKFGMIDIDAQDFISIANWDKHQNVDGLEKLRKGNALRQAKHREKKKLEALGIEASSEFSDQCAKSNVTDNSAITSRNALDIDKEKELKHMRNAPRNSDELLEKQFAEFWETYGMKKDRKRSFSAFKTQVKKHGFEKIMQGVAAYLRECEIKGTDKQYIKRPTTFLNGECFLDEYETTIAAGGTTQGFKKPDAPITYGSFDIDNY